MSPLTLSLKISCTAFCGLIEKGEARSRSRRFFIPSSPPPHPTQGGLTLGPERGEPEADFCPREWRGRGPCGGRRQTMSTVPQPPCQNTHTYRQTDRQGGRGKEGKRTMQ